MQQLDTPTLSPQSMSFWTSDYKKKRISFIRMALNDTTKLKEKDYTNVNVLQGS